jgi:hypothetical protein
MENFIIIENLKFRKEKISKDNFIDFFIYSIIQRKKFMDGSYLFSLDYLYKTIYPDICFFFENTTDYFQCSGGGMDIYRQLVQFKGVTQDDIDRRSSQFLCYISTLRETGTLLYGPETD